MVMRRPPLCTSISNENTPVGTGQTVPSSSSELKESKLSKVKRIITGSILLGRKSKSNNTRDLAREPSVTTTTGSPESHGDKVNGVTKHQQAIDKEGKADGKDWNEHKTKSYKMGRRGNEENMDTDEGNRRNEVSICLTKENGAGKKLKEICIEISQNQTSAITEVVLKPRKRKERLDSGGSTKQEHKVIRSSSEERPERGNMAADAVRRVSSHEELSRGVLAELNGGETREPEPWDLEEEEHERRRRHERASRAPRGRRNLPKKRTKGARKKTTQDEVQVGEVAAAKQEASSSGRENRENRDCSPPHSKREEPTSPPLLDIASLHRQMEGSEPITSRSKVLSPQEEDVSPTIEALISPRNSLVSRLVYLDPSMPPSPPRDHSRGSGDVQDPQERRMTKQINSIKRQLRKYEEGFKEEFGYKPSHADKMANKDIKKMISDLSKLKSQLKQFKEDAADIRSALATSKQLNFLTSLEGGPHNTSPNGSSSRIGHKNIKTMQEVLLEVEKRLEDKRELSGRTGEVTDMNRGDLLEEKLAVQKALLHLENVFGRPVTRHDRDLVRPLYQRYRTLKRLVTRNSAAKLNNSTSELATILEHETMEFASSGSFDLGESVLSAPEGLNLQAAPPPPPPQAPPQVPQDDVLNSCSSSSDSASDSNLHALPLSQLLEQQKAAREEKKKLRRNLRDFEEQFQQDTGRRATKLDRQAMEEVYVQYKQSKARLRLVNALVVKKSCRKRNSC